MKERQNEYFSAASLLIKDSRLMTMRLLIFASLVFLSACASMRQVGQKDGKALFEAFCSPGAGDCHKMAQKQCGDKYDVTGITGDFGDTYMTFQCK